MFLNVFVLKSIIIKNLKSISFKKKKVILSSGDAVNAIDKYH